MPTEYSQLQEDINLTPDVGLPYLDNGKPFIDGNIVEEDRGYDNCKAPYRVFASLTETDRRQNDVNSAWRTGDVVSFTFYKKVEGLWVTATYSPTKVAFVNESNAWYCTIQWNDVLSSDGVGCYKLVTNSQIAGATQPFIDWGIYTLEPYMIGTQINPNVIGTARVLSEFNSMNDYLGLDFTGSWILDSVRLSGKVGYFNDNTEIDMVEYLDGTNEKVKIEDFVTYELRLNLMGFCTVEMLRMHLLQADDQWVSDYNYDSYSYLTDDVPVILHEGLQPEFFDGSRNIKGVVKFKDKISKRRTHFHNNRKTAQEDRPPSPSPICPPCPPCPAAYKSAKLIKTGQVTSYRTGDDGDLEEGRNVDWATLPENNPFGNTLRYTDRLGTAIYADGILLDWSTFDGATVLGWRITDNGVNITWDNAVDGALAVSIGTYTTGWRLPNMIELHILCSHLTNLYFNFAPFNNANNYRWWSGTTDMGSTNDALVKPNRRWEYGAQNKTGSVSLRYYPCRTFTVTGTVLT